MKKSALFLFAIIFSYSFSAQAELSVKVKIAQMIGAKTIETIKTISSDYNQDIVISQEGLKNRIVLNLKKFKDILVNGNKINPVQIDMKLVNDSKKIIGKTQTVTSFYDKSAQFKVQSSGIPTDTGDIRVSLNFEEI